MQDPQSRFGLNVLVVIAVAAPAVTQASVVTEARKIFDQGDHSTVVALMRKEIDVNPGHEEAYALLALTYEKLGKNEDAATTWRTLKTISRVEERISMARLGLLRTRGPYAPPVDRKPGEGWENDPFHVPVGKIRWDNIHVPNNVDYNNELPPFVTESKNFTVLACTQELADEASKLCEKYLEFLLDQFLDGRKWALRVPILIYKDRNDYISVGKFPASSAGVTVGDHLGRSKKVALFIVDEDNQIDKDALLDTLPHELTHVVINEFFGAQDTPRWLHEAIARRLEQTRHHYEEAAKTGRDVVAGEYYRFRDLFAAENYPDGFFRVWRFYEQSATIVLFLLEQGPESMVAFLQALKDQKGHDEAVAAALGIPAEGAVEELERRWVEWMKERFVNDLSDEEKTDPVIASTVASELLVASGDELATVEAMSDWTKIDTGALKSFKGLGGSRSQWRTERGRLVGEPQRGQGPTGLAIRMNEEAPLVLRCKVRWRGGSSDQGGRFGIGMLDHRADDTGIHVFGSLSNERPRRVTCVVNDDIALYVEGKCVGRVPALRAADIDEDIDYPLCFLAYGPIEFYDVEAAMIEEFVAAAVGTND